MCQIQYEAYKRFPSVNSSFKELSSFEKPMVKFFILDSVPADYLSVNKITTVFGKE